MEPEGEQNALVSPPAFDFSSAYGRGMPVDLSQLFSQMGEYHVLCTNGLAPYSQTIALEIIWTANNRMAETKPAAAG